MLPPKQQKIPLLVPGHPPKQQKIPLLVPGHPPKQQKIPLLVPGNRLLNLQRNQLTIRTRETNR